MRSSGFSLIEIIIVVSLLSFIFSLGLAVTFRSYESHLFNAEIDTLANILIKARSNAQSNMLKSAHGVFIKESDYILFSGLLFDENNSMNQKTPRNKSIAVTGMQEVIFEAVSGNPDASGDILLTNGNQTGSISISQEGRIDW